MALFAAPVQWHKLPDTLFVHQIFPVTIRFISPTPQELPSFSFKNAKGLEIRFKKTKLQRDDLYFYKTFYFKVLSQDARLPDITIKSSAFSYTLQGKKLAVKRLNAPSDFCNVLAKDLFIKSGKSVQFNKNLNLVVLKLSATLGNLEDFHIKVATKEQIKEFNETFPYANAIYYAFIPAYITQLKFSYFDTRKREFTREVFTIRVKDEIVSTQSELNPAHDKNKTLKITLTISLGILFLLIAFWIRSGTVGFFAALLLLYGAYLFIPLQKVCVKAQSKIYILPTKNSTVFRLNPTKRDYIKLNQIDGYTKIEIDKQLVGWVKNEDLCKN